MSHLAALTTALVGLCFGGCNRESFVPPDIPQGVAIQQEEMISLQQELAKTVVRAPAKAMNQCGLVGALGGAHVKLLKTGTHELILPIPQLADAQVPVTYFISSTPRDAAIEFRLRKRDGSNAVVSVQLKGERNQEIQIDWSSVILIAKSTVSPNNTQPDLYRVSSSCVQSEAEEITELAEELWPDNDKVSDYLLNIQQCIRNMKQVEQPRSLDAERILKSGANGICTANSNLAAALLRSKGIASRSLAVIPPISRRLEMHRIVEYFDQRHWLSFDPSLLQADIPMKPWQSVIMAKTTISDEQIAMQPRMGTMLGCPYAQELELMSRGISLWGQEFFWTIAKPIAEFEADAKALALAAEAWNHYLEVGTLSQGQINAATAKNASEFLEFLRTK